jgi:hypothetical protein
MTPWQVNLTIGLTLGSLLVITLLAQFVTRSACRRAIVQASELALRQRHQEGIAALELARARLALVAPLLAPDLWAELRETLQDIQKHEQHGKWLELGEVYTLGRMIDEGSNPFLAYPARRQELERKYPDLLERARAKFGPF